MADEYDTTPVFGIARIGDRPREQPRRRPAVYVPAGHHMADAASIMGIPEGDLTPPVQDAITTLMAEIDHVRAEMENHRHREAWLEDLVYHHPLMPMLNRRGLMREVPRIVAHLDPPGVTASLVVLHIDGMERLRARHGLAAGDAALQHLGGIIGSAVRQSDVTANLDGSDFAVILTVADAPAVESKAHEIAEQIAGCALAWGGEVFRFTAGIGIHELTVGEEGEAALAAADQARRAPPDRPVTPDGP